MPNVRIATKNWQLQKEKGLCSAVQTCQSTHASILDGCLPSTPSLHVSVWVAVLLICSEELQSREVSLLSSVELDYNPSWSVCSVTLLFTGAYVYLLVAFTASVCVCFVSRMEEAELLKERFQAITVSACCNSISTVCLKILSKAA